MKFKPRNTVTHPHLGGITDDRDDDIICIQVNGTDLDASREALRQEYENWSRRLLPESVLMSQLRHEARQSNHGREIPLSEDEYVERWFSTYLFPDASQVPTYQERQRLESLLAVLSPASLQELCYHLENRTINSIKHSDAMRRLLVKYDITFLLDRENGEDMAAKHIGGDTLVEYVGNVVEKIYQGWHVFPFYLEHQSTAIILLIKAKS